MMLKLAARGKTFDGSVSVYLEFDYDRKQTQISISDNQLSRHRIKRPDIDNLSKMVLEAIEKSGLVNDDSQVAYLRAEKTE